MELGFIITRHVRDERTNKFWRHCLECIRENYASNPVIIIDDNSPYSFTENDDKIVTSDVNCKLIHSEYPGCAELLPYYYFWKLRPFDRAVFLHDSVFIRGPINIDEKAAVEPLWYFKFASALNENLDNIRILVNHMKEADLIKSYIRSNMSWFGYFGVMCHITWEAIDNIQTQYDLFILLEHVNSRPMRMALERIMGALFHLAGYRSDRLAIYGYLFEDQRWADQDFENYYPNRNNQYWLGRRRAVKIWSSR